MFGLGHPSYSTGLRQYAPSPNVCSIQHSLCHPKCPHGNSVGPSVGPAYSWHSMQGNISLVRASSWGGVDFCEGVLEGFGDVLSRWIMDLESRRCASGGSFGRSILQAIAGLMGTCERGQAWPRKVISHDRGVITYNNEYNVLCDSNCTSHHSKFKLEC